ncbi:hypothetical protein G4B88_022299 [Cannabis sativa]|uniref:Acid phosphatase n=1 Tax=Cannabis sativa TaxID=3483 RepID=A0A7J6HVH8_CANSA|nr:hypothetical protein G4B88_022299 [Cannabis sativa]
MSRIMLVSLFVATLVASAYGSSYYPLITNEIHLIRPKSGSGGTPVNGLSCLSWRFGVETNNIINWKTVPLSCEDYIGHYMLGSQYRKDSKTINKEAFFHASSLNISKNGNDAWVFDIDETTLSNLPYYAENGFGAVPYNATKFNEWVFTGNAPALPESLKLYNKLVNLGVKIVFITGRTEDQRDVTEANLKAVGYNTWDRLVLKKKVEEDGYRIIGNSGDQWSDLLGTNIGLRTFKLPDPMYYIDIPTTNGKGERFRFSCNQQPNSLAEATVRSGGGHVKGVSCLSWRYGVETNSIINWKTIPVACEDYVGHYMLGDQYRKDSKAINDEAFLYVKTLNLSKNAANDVVWVFDIDETTLSNLPYYAQHGFGVERFNATSFNEWVFTGKALALPESLKLYKKTEDQRTVTETNLRSVGYNSWDKLLLKGKNFVGKPAAEYKSAQRKILEKEGYKIIGNMGDQWSDLLGTNIGLRTFKLPDPMYYIS